VLKIGAKAKAKVDVMKQKNINAATRANERYRLRSMELERELNMTIITNKFKLDKLTKQMADNVNARRHAIEEMVKRGEIEVNIIQAKKEAQAAIDAAKYKNLKVSLNSAITQKKLDVMKT